MASSGKSTKESTKNTKDSKKSQGLPLADKILGPNTMGNQQYVPEPLTEEHRRIFQSHVLIPMFIFGKTHAMLGPLSNPNVDHNKLKEFFQTYHRYKPIACAKKPKVGDETHTEENPNLNNRGNPSIDEPIDLIYMNSGFRVFQSCPLFRDASNYLGWLEKIGKKNPKFGKK